MTKEEMLRKIKDTIKPTRIGIPGHTVCNHIIRMIGDVLERLKINEHIAYEGMSGSKLRSYVVESRGLYQHPIDDQENYIIELIYNLCQQGT